MRRHGVIVLLAAVLSGCAAPEPQAPPVVVPPPAPQAQAQAQALPVYYVASTPAGYRLQREFHRVPTADPASDAVREMLAPPADPDYRTPWPAGTALRSPVVAGADVITVDLTAAATGAPADPAAAQAALQQLVFTVQGTLQSSVPVRLLVDGAPAGRVLGGVDASAPLTRGDVYAVRSLVQIDSPAQGATVAGPDVVVSGEAAVFEATVLWEVRRAGAVVQQGVTSSAEGQRFAPYRFTLRLEPGEYQVRVLEDDPSDGEGRPVLSDDKTITVTAG
jgi:hypothetical protein